MATLKLFLLGAPRVEIGTQSAPLHRRKALALLAFIAANTDKQRRETLANLFWPDSPRERTRSNLRRDISALRKGLGEKWFQIDNSTVALNPASGYWLDTQAFQALLMSHLGPPSVSQLTEAVKLYRGEFLKGFSLPRCTEFDEWQFMKAEHYRQAYTRALEQLIKIMCQRNESAGAILYILKLLVVEPLNEHAHRMLIEQYVTSNQINAALHHFKHYEHLLKNEPGIPLSLETKAIYEHIAKIQKRVDDFVRSA